MYIFDIIWYAFIENQRHYQNYSGTPEFFNKVKSSCEEIDKYKNDVPVSWNKLLVGYIIKKESLENGAINFEIIWNKIQHIIEIYKKYISFEVHQETSKQYDKDGSSHLKSLKQLQGKFNKR